MPRNLKGGNKAKKQGSKNVGIRKTKETPLPNIDDNQHIGKVIKILGDCRFTVKILSNNGLKNEEIISWLAASKKKYGRIILESYVLVSKREFENKCDILYPYDKNDVDFLLNNKNIEREESQQNAEGIIFGNDDEDMDIDDI